LTILHTFCPNFPRCSADGEYPQGPLVLGANGLLYGTTSAAGSNSNAGAFFAITPAGNLTTIYRFCSLPNCTDGSSPTTGLVQGSDGNFYGAGSTIFKITPQGQLTTLYTFCSQTNCTDGSFPVGLVQGSDGNFYGATVDGGANGRGTVFEITPNGQFTTLHTFCAQTNCTDGSSPIAGLVQGTDGIFYGTTSIGGNSTNCHGAGCGTVYNLSMGIGQFVLTSRGFGKAGNLIAILGNNLTSTTSVTFNGTPATFTVVGNTLIKATVPTGATSGTVEVTTPSGTLSSNVVFQVVP
jgi:uncharacterized repeat protein (TIGR03803 family)